MNFCVASIGTTIRSSQIECDGCEASNLLLRTTEGRSSGVWMGPKKGFMVDHFVRPPITLKIEFPVCIDISHITLKPKFGTQSSSAFMVQTETINKRWKSGESCVGVQHMVAREFLSPEEIPDVIVFANPRYEARPPFALLSKSGMMNASGNGVLRNLSVDMKHPLPYATSGVINVEITILRTCGSSVPALGGLEIWGQPCRRCPKETVDKLLVAWMRLTRKSYTSTAVTKPNKTEDDEKTDDVTGTSRRRMRPESIDMPEDFVDPITNDIMCQPIRLPCGIAVDATTLEKYYREEEKWGRLPNDPFTGKCYTDMNKPIGDISLKTRIDHFILQNSSEEPIRKLPRTLGSSTNFPVRDLTIFRTSSLVSSSTASAPKDSPPLRETQPPDLAFIPNSEYQAAKIICADSVLQAELSKMFSSGNSYLPSATSGNINPHLESKPKTTTCELCKAPIGEIAFYKPSNSTCYHVQVCRNCLIALDKKTWHKCSVCDASWTPNAMERIHTQPK